MKLTKEDYSGILRREIDAAQGYDADVLADQRARALDYYYGLMSPAVSEGRSTIVSHDVADVVHSLLAQIMPMFSSSMLQFAPESEEDEAQAQLESDFVQRKIEQNRGYSVLYASAFDALLQGNGWIKVDVDEDVQVETERYPLEIEDIDLYTLQQPRRQDEQVEVKAKSDYYEIKRTWIDRKLVVRCVSPDVMLFSASWDQFEMEELRFVAERILYTKSDLLAMDVPQDAIDSIPDAAEDYWPAIRAREGEFQDTIANEQTETQDAEILKECFDCYIRIDIEGNGTSELRRALYAGNQILVESEAECIPYATGSPVVIPHRIQGVGMFSLMGSIQDSKTSILRSFEDTLEASLLGRYEAVEGSVNMDDALDGRINGVVRVRAPGSFTPLQTADTTGQAIAGLNYLDTVREQRGGAALDMNDADRQLMASSAAAATGVQSAHEAMAGFYCNNLVNTLMKNTFMLVHKKMRYDMPGEQGAKLRGKWVQTDPSQWKDRKHLEVTAGMTTKERNNKIQGLTQVIQQQLGWIEQGFEGIITDRGKVYAAASDWIRAAEIGEPDEYLIDPESEEAQQQAQEMTQKEQEQQQQAQQMQEQMIQMQMQLEQQKLEMDKYKTDEELKYKYFDSKLDAGIKAAQDEQTAEIEEAKLTADIIKTLETNNGTNGQAESA